jgi:hypothetical protein
MLRKAEERFWMNSLEKMCRQQKQNMLSKIKITKKIDDLAKIKVLNFFFGLLKKERSTLNVLQVLNKKNAEKFKDTFLLQFVKNELKKNWYNIIKDWLSKVRVVSNIVPEKETDLFGIIGESQLKTLIKVRENYNKELDRFNAQEIRTKFVSCLYSKQKKKHFVLKKRGGCSAHFFIKNKFVRKVRRARICIEMPYENIKIKFREKGYIKGDYPASNYILSTNNSVDIIRHYLKLAKGVLNFYRCADNRRQVAKLINWYLRYSLLKTLAQKYSASVSKMIGKFSLTLSVWVLSKENKKKLFKIVSYITLLEINRMKKKFLVSNLDVNTENFKRCFDVIRIKTFKYSNL